MSAKPVAWIDILVMQALSEMEVGPVPTILYKTRPYEKSAPLYASSPAQARALAIAEACQIIHGYINSYLAMGYGDVSANSVRFDLEHNILSAIRALSFAPSVTEEWIARCALHDGLCIVGLPKHLDRCAQIRATLAALGVEVKS